MGVATVLIIHHDDLHDITFDIVKYGCYHHKTTLQFAAIRNAQTQTERDNLATKYGIREKPSVFDNITHNRHIQSQVEGWPLLQNLPGIFLVNFDFFCLISGKWRIPHLGKLSVIGAITLKL